jgi:RNA polymerase sigma-70 factor (ECF subfamily)
LSQNVSADFSSPPASNLPFLIDLMRRVAEQEKAAFRELYHATAPKLYGVVLAIVREKSLAEDVMQDAYIKIWQRADEYESGKGTPMAWMTVIARNRSLDEVRKRQRLISSYDVGGFDDIPAEVAEPMAARIESENDRILMHCLDGLEDVKKEMILLAYLYGMSRDMLAQRFDAPVATIKTWLRRGLSDLRACMGAAHV